MTKFVWTALAVLAVAAMYITAFHTDWIVDPTFPKAYALTSDKCLSSCTDPNRPSYDSWGNEYDYAGNLIKATTCTVDPITGQPNPVSCTVKPDLTIVPTPSYGGK